MSRLGHSVLSVSIVAGLGFATLSIPAFSQEAAPSAFTAENVLPGNPFGTLPIDRSRIPEHLENLAAFLARFSDEQTTELRQRCVVITANADAYDENSVALCNAVLAPPGAG